MMSPHQHHQVYATHGIASSGFGMGSGPSSVAGTSSAGSLSPDLGGSPSPGGAGVNGKRRTRTRTQQAANGRMSGRGVGPAAVGVWEERTMGDSWVGVEENVIEEEPEKEEGVDDVLLGGSLRRVVNGHVSVGDEEEGEEGFGEGGFNVLLADAILKRPGSIRVRSFSKKDRPLDFGGVESEKGSSPTKTKHDATVVLEQEEEVERMTEFTFPSLADLGNVHYRSDSGKVNGDCAVVFGASSGAGDFPAIPSVVPDALASSELLEDNKASWVLPSFVEESDQSSVVPGVDVAPTEIQEIPVASESRHDLEITQSKEGMVPMPTESKSHSELPETIPPVLKGTNVVTLASEQ